VFNVFVCLYQDLKKTGVFFQKAQPSGFYWVLGFCVVFYVDGDG